MLRAAALLVLLLGALSVMTTASAYKVARPSNSMTISVTANDSALLAISPGSNGTYLGWVQGAGTGTVTLELGRGPGGATGYTFDTNASHTAYRVLRITNQSSSAKSVTINHGSGNVTVISGYVYPGGTLAGGTTYALAANGGYVEVNLKIAAGTTGGTFTYTVTAN